jgi:hypothetical protein
MRASIAAALLLAACNDASAPPPPEPKPQSQAPTAQPGAATAPVDEAPSSGAAGEGAAQVVQTYYARIEARKYAEAYALREPSPGAPSVADFAANFERYAEYHVTIGAPSEPVTSGGWDYVEVPVQPYGRMKDGSPLASAGTVTLRRRSGGGEWRIFTKG